MSKETEKLVREIVNKKSEKDIKSSLTKILKKKVLEKMKESNE